MSIQTVQSASGKKSWAPSDVRHLVTELLSGLPSGWPRLGMAILLSVLATGASVALMGTSAWLLSRAAEHPPVLMLQVAVVGVRFFGISRGVFRYVERLFGHDLALRLQASLRMSVYEKLTGTTLLGTRRGDLLVRVTADVESIMDVIVRVVLPFCSASVVILGTSTVLSIFEWRTAVVLLGCSLFAGVGLPWLTQRWSAAADRALVPLRGQLGERVHEISRSAADLMAYGADTAQLNRLAEIDAQLRKAEDKAAWVRGVAAGGQLLVMGIAVAVALVFGGEAVIAGKMWAVNLAVLCLTPLALHESFQDLTKAAQTLTHARGGLSRIVELLRSTPVGSGDRAAEPDAPASDDSSVIPDTPVGSVIASEAKQSSSPVDSDNSGSTPVLQFSDLSIGWPGNPVVLENLSLEEFAGEKVAVTGTSGVGKTTLAATIMGLIPPVSGQLNAPARISYLAQDAHIFNTTVAENVRIGNPKATDEQVTQALAKAGAAHLDPQRIIGEAASTISGGEARRLALARVLVAASKPALVILDEPTEHLDQETATALLDDLFAALGDTALFAITHDADVITRCDREFHLG